MARWEVCRLVRQHGSWSKDKWLAILDTPQGPSVLDESAVFKQDQYYEAGLQEYSKLAGRLSSAGWEPIGSENGLVFVFKRYVP